MLTIQTSVSLRWRRQTTCGSMSNWAVQECPILGTFLPWLKLPFSIFSNTLHIILPGIRLQRVEQSNEESYFHGTPIGFCLLSD